MTGLLEWSNSIRFTMSNDPGRLLFQDQLDAHGFHFLDDYLDNILSGPSQDLLIELVKTPGRKKTTSKKLKTFNASKMNHTISVEGEVDINFPINNFHKALLKSKDHVAVDSSETHEPLLFKPSPSQTVDELFSPNLVPHTSLGEPSSTQEPPNTGLLAPRSEQNDLSVIVEDDENTEPSPLSMQQPQNQPEHLPEVTHDIHDLGRHAPPPPPALTVDQSEAMDLSEPSSSTSELVTQETSQSQAQEHASVLERLPAMQYHEVASSLPQILPWIPPGPPDEVPLPLTTPTGTLTFGQDINIPLRDPDELGVSPKDSHIKPGVPLFPTLPAPMPLRKSIRAPPDPSIGSGPLGAATPGAPPGGKRTSWLKKAREVKALEVNSKHITQPLALQTSGQPLPVSSSSNCLKRKSGDMLMELTATGLEDEERAPKSAKSLDSDVAPLKAALEPVNYPSHLDLKGESIDQLQTGQEGMLDRFKRTVEGLGAKVGKSTGKSLGAGAAVSALAEARAAAEARVAERHYQEEVLTGALAHPSKDIAPNPDTETPAETELAERRLSVSDLFPTHVGSLNNGKSKASFELASSDTIGPEPRSKGNYESTSTTPPDSPSASRPMNFILPSGPVFNKPPPVFVPPLPASRPVLKDSAINLPPPPIFLMPTVGIAARLPSLSKIGRLAKESALDSIKSSCIDETDVLAWVPDPQDTQYSSGFEPHPDQHALDEDDSWPTADKVAGGIPWTFGENAKEDSMTWSTLPSQSQRLDTVTSHKDYPTTQDKIGHTSRPIPGAFGIEVDDTDDAEDMEEDVNLVQDDTDPEDVVIHGKSSANVLRSESQMSMASSQSSQSNAGFFGQASKLFSSALGTSKKNKPEVKKVLQMAAVAAKKQQEENDKKAARLRDMENRRQLAIQRKAEEEKARALEQEKKIKEEGERRKREREEHTDKRPLKMNAKKARFFIHYTFPEEDITKKRKLTVTEPDKKELRKPGSKPGPNSSMKQPIALGSSAVYNSILQTAASSTSKPVDLKPVKPPITSAQKGKAKVPPKQQQLPDDDLPPPSQLVQIQMAARAKAQLQAANLVPEPPIASESIELPEINSEYSDSDDEDRPKSFPEWAQSPELREALQVQSTINPDDIFGAIRPLRMEELFKTRTSRFRARTSSANWTGSDRLTVEEERNYAKRMGFK
ncbi:hypothetical protein H0H81_005311 [Sphagnurus paluster]|uniref:Inner centromere protein ARK-binding domain-containing protein n=1 Tax=Sphagnurus paluster TaxID=117069 RepID=A0A9P7G2C7_9AGAR|nr:hypothetical protein H0H81_005311 [Sphagnurus paluster]